MSSSDRLDNRPIPDVAWERHIVDQLIEERAQGLRADPLVWPLVRTFLYPVLRYRAAVQMADRIGPMDGREVMATVSDMLRIRLNVEGAHHIPRSGPVLIAPNHPTGIADGFAVHGALLSARPDMIFFANRDALRVAPNLRDVLIPVEWVNEKRSRERSRETLRSTAEAFRGGRAVVLFPSGRLAKMTPEGLREQPWQNSIVSLARKYDAPIVPVHITAQNSWLYYFFWRVSPELKDMTLFHELLNKRGAMYRLQFGELIQPRALPDDINLGAQRLQTFVEQNLANGKTKFSANK
jgi:putative hemolysin